MKKFIKIFLIIICAILAVITIGYFTIKAYLTPDTVRTIAQKVASESIQHPVEIGKVGLRIGFKIGITVDDVSMPNVKGYSPGPVVQVERASLYLRLLPLLRRQIVIGSIDLSGMEINLERNKEGVLNIVPIISKEGKGSGWNLSLSSVSISNGDIHYTDAKSKTELRIKDIKQKITFKDNAISAGGENVFYLLKSKGLPEMMVKIANEIEYNMLKKSIQIKKLTARHELIHLDASGTIAKMEMLNLIAHVNIDDMVKLKSLIPIASRPEKLSGALKADLSVSGTIKEPKIDGECEIKNVTIVPKGMNRGMEKIQGSASFDTNAIRSIIIKGEIGSAKFDVNGSVLNLKKPVLNLTAKINGDLNDVESFTDEMEGIRMKGPFDVKLNIKGRVKKPSYSGEYNVRNGHIDGIGLSKPITNLSIKGTIQEDNVKIDKCSGQIGRSDFSFSGNISNFKKPVIQLVNKSNTIDLDELIPKPKKDKEKVGKAVPMTLRGNVQINTLTGMDMVFSNINTHFTYENGIIDLRDCSADAFDGKVKFDFYYNANSPEPYRITTHMTSLSTKKVLKRFLKFENLEGRLTGMSNFKGNGLSQKEVISNLSASGNLKVKNGVFKNFKFLTDLLAWLGIKDYKNVKLDDLVLYFKIDNGKTEVKDWALSSSVGDFLTNGTISLDGKLNLAITTTLSKKYSDIVKNYHGNWIFPIDKKGRATIDIIASGTLTSPKFMLDKNKINNRLKGKIKDEFDKKKKDLEDKLKDLFKRP